MAFTPRLVLVTTPTLDDGRAIAKILLEHRLAACVNLVPGVESHYHWEGGLETATEILLLIKTSTEHFEALRELIALHHPYECPEVIAVNPREIAPAYRKWWKENLHGSES
jgi:periplasmic divalent cation tolerance protein